MFARPQGFCLSKTGILTTSSYALCDDVYVFKEYDDKGMLMFSLDQQHKDRLKYQAFQLKRRIIEMKKYHISDPLENQMKKLKSLCLKHN